MMKSLMSAFVLILDLYTVYGKMLYNTDLSKV